MIINFTVKNFMSFKDKITVCFAASKLTKYNYRIAKSKKNNLDILPIAAFFGANASGKSNLIKALAAIKTIITRQPILQSNYNRSYIIPYALDNNKEATTFAIEFLLIVNGEEKIYEFSICLNNTIIFKEKLLEIINGSETCIYQRELLEKKDDDGNNTYSYEVNECLYKTNFDTNNSNENDSDEKKQEKENENKLIMKLSNKIAAKSNQLFLHKVSENGIKFFEPIINWFRYNLQIVPKNRHNVYNLMDTQTMQVYINTLYEKDTDSFKKFNQYLQQLDNNIAGLDFIEIDNNIHFNRNQAKLNIKKFKYIGYEIFDKIQRIYMKYDEKQQRIITKKLVTCHKTAENKIINFDLRMESDGNLQLLDILPMLYHLQQLNQQKKQQENNYVLIIDEIDSSWHGLLTKKLLRNYLDTCNNNTRTQLLFTTHDNNLLDTLELMRLDEEYLINNDSGSSSISSVIEFKDIKFDQVRKYYMHRLIGGVPEFEE